ncbi:MAG: hypothetical protein Q4Q23_06455 [Methanobacteriaceae archaeon]|nr:hypothetical protein [Methanobacteriaceae archaeon]
MKSKSILFLFLIILTTILFSFTIVSAAEIDTQNNTNIGNTVNIEEKELHQENIDIKTTSDNNKNIQKNNINDNIKEDKLKTDVNISSSQLFSESKISNNQISQKQATNKVTSWSQLITEINNGNSVQLGSNIVSNAGVFSIKNKVTIEGKGYLIRINPKTQINVTSSLIINNVVFDGQNKERNTSFILNNGNLIIKNSIIQNIYLNEVMEAAIYNTKTMTFINTTLRNNIANDCCAIVLYGNNYNISNCNFINNTFYDHRSGGGVIYGDYNTIIGSTFSNNFTYI